MLEDAYTKNQDTIVVMSSDTDLCPALHKIKAQGAKVIYVCFADSINRAVSAVANQTLTIPIPKVQQYLKDEPEPQPTHTEQNEEEVEDEQETLQTPN